MSGVRPPWGERLGRPVQCDRSEHRGLRGAGPAAGTLARPAPQSDACSPWRVCGCARASVGLRVCVPLGPGVFTPQSCVHVSCPPCARARRVDCVCLHLMCNSVCVFLSRNVISRGPLRGMGKGDTATPPSTSSLPQGSLTPRLRSRG